MTNKEEKIFTILQEAVISECSIQCSKCKKSKVSFNTDDFYFTERLIEIGWTVKRNKVICNECNEKQKQKERK